MILYPALDLLNGHVVQLVGGERDTEQVDLPDPLAVVDRWVTEGSQWLHVVDLNGAFGQENHQDLILRILEDSRIKIQVGGGIRTEEQLRTYLEGGAQRVVVGTKALRDPMWLRTMAHRYPDQIVLAVDAREGRVVAHGWVKNTDQDFIELAKKVQDLPLAGLLYTAVHVEGRMQGMDRKGLERLIPSVRLPIIASGGITTLEDVRFLQATGAAGAVLGMALYTGRLNFREARRCLGEATP